jgi:hypothetical protein
MCPAASQLSVTLMRHAELRMTEKKNWSSDQLLPAAFAMVVNTQAPL